ncbi:tyrosine-type recombinase/integrase [Dokdonella sp.]|uniref:tyrosine-type recombinase/integrase n=1 Tax=Dokdonella sp. TaxID=2291710 RepID=UPI0039C8AA0D
MATKFARRSIFRRVADRAGLPRSITPHTLRHTMASNAAHAGLDAATIQGLGGWKTRAMAERYTHAARLATAMEAVQSRLQGRTIAPELQRPPEKRT